MIQTPSPFSGFLIRANRKPTRWTSIILGGLIAALVPVSVVAQADRPDSTLTLLGGWDFNGGTATSVSSVNARYSQSQDTGATAGSYFAAGTAFSPGNATFGVATFTGGEGATFASARTLSSTNSATNLTLLSTVGLQTSNNALGIQPTTGTPKSAILLSNTSTLDTGRATFKVSSLSTNDTFSGIKLDLQARNLGAAGTFGNGLTGQVSQAAACSVRGVASIVLF